MNKDQLADIFLNILTKQSFASWYESDFEDYITSEDNAPTKEDILKELKWHLSRELNFMESNLRWPQPR